MIESSTQVTINKEIEISSFFLLTIILYQYIIIYKRGDKMKKKRLLYLDDENYKKLQMLCITLNKSVSKYIDELIKQEIEKLEKGE